MTNMKESRGRKTWKVTLPYTRQEFINLLVNFISQHHAVRMYKDNENQLMKFCNILYINGLAICNCNGLAFKLTDEEYNKLVSTQNEKSIKSDITADVIAYEFLESVLTCQFLEQLNDLAYLKLTNLIIEMLLLSGYYHYIEPKETFHTNSEKYHVRQSMRYELHLE